MAQTYLNVPFKDKDSAKSLGARWDSAARQWFVPEGRELAPFSAWLTGGAISSRQTEVALFEGASAVQVPGPKGMPLSQLLAGVAAAVAQAYQQAVWTVLEVVQVKMHSGHVYLEVSERDATGRIVAKAQATIWASTAQRILPAFELATGAWLGPGIKLLVSARPVFKAQHGFSLDIEAMDPDFTLGELEARKREIRAQLQREGVFGRNQQLAQPWDYNRVLVVAPANGAGLGDFQKEAQRLQNAGVCRFTYVLSRFQGEGAAQDILASLSDAMSSAMTGTSTAADFDAVVIIRGGGAVNDLAYLNDYALARWVCLCRLPVLTGIGHERDNTLLDEVAHTRYDTPSKVIAGIEQAIAARTACAQADLAGIVQAAERAGRAWSARIEHTRADIEAQAARHLARSKESTSGAFSAIQLAALQSVHTAREASLGRVTGIRQGAAAEVASARNAVPALLTQVRSQVGSALQRAALTSEARMKAILDRAALDADRQRQALARAMADTASLAGQSLVAAAASSQALMREIAGQGPDKTLGRGFVIVRTRDGHTASRAAQLGTGSEIELQFSDGKRQARVHETPPNL
jgi:exodeoxyribonuclease VII large subunit